MRRSITLSFVLALFVVGIFGLGEVHAVLPEDIKDWKNCSLSTATTNNKPSDSRTLAAAVDKINTVYPGGAFSNWPWNPQKGLRKDCSNSSWFNNENPQWDIFKKDGEVSERECFEKFLEVASDPENYWYDQSTENPYGKDLKAYYGDQATYFGLAAGTTNKDIANHIATYIKNNIKQTLPSTKDTMTFVSGTPTSWTKGTTSSVFSTKDVYYLQAAINTLGCGMIRQDGVLGNYTLKSFCECAKPQQQPCANLKAVPNSNPAKVTWVLDPANKVDYSACEIRQNTEKSGPNGNDIVVFFEGSSCNAKQPEGTLCCPENEYNLTKKPRWNMTTEDWSCGCIPPDQVELQCNNADQIIQGDTCKVSVDCKTTNGSENLSVKICPCAGNKDYTKQSDGSRKCPCPIQDASSLQNLCGTTWLKDKTSVQQGEKCTNGDKTYEICYCGEGKQYIKKDGQRKCDDCKPGTKRDDAKQKCVCDPSYAEIDPNHCCGIKLNTNVPFIGRCINFAAENDKDAVYTDSYGNGNTTITTNVLNAFPLLMTGLGKILLTVILLASFGILVYAGMRMTMGGADQSAPSDAKGLIIKVVIGIALLGASGVILHAINPNFFQ